MVVYEEKKSMKENRTEKELVLTNFNWKKAEEKIPKHTATGLDEVPVRLNNELSPKSKEGLLKAVERT